MNSPAAINYDRLYLAYKLLIDAADAQQQAAAGDTRQDAPAAVSAQQTIGHGQSTPQAGAKQTGGQKDDPPLR